MVICKHGWVAREYVAVLGGIQMRFENGRAALSEGHQQLEHQAKKLGVFLALETRRLKHAHYASAALLYDIHLIANEQCPDGRTADGQHFVRQCLKHDTHLTARQGIATKYAAKYDNEANYI
jgi:hypothetical protein